MSELLHQLGINWKLLLSQGVNFLILLIALNFLVYKPLIKIVEERRKKIELGVKAGEEAENRFKEIDRIKEQKIKEAEEKALEIISSSEKNANLKSKEILSSAEKKAALLLEEARETAERKKIEELEKVFGEAKQIIKDIISKTVELDPSRIDDALVSKSINEVKRLS